MKLGILGYGKMGKAVERIARERGHDTSVLTKEQTAAGDFGQVDALIDFSSADIAPTLISGAIEAGIPVVSGTTGWKQHLEEVREFCIERGGAFLWAPNFSVGMHITFALNLALARMMNHRDEYHVRIAETHHTEKRDAPSGTAIALAEQIVNTLKRKDHWELVESEQAGDGVVLPVLAKRLQDVKGVHHVIYDGPFDTITISHEAHSRDGFALGAVLAAEWLKEKKGVYVFEDVLSDLLA